MEIIKVTIGESLNTQVPLSVLVTSDLENHTMDDFPTNKHVVVLVDKMKKVNLFEIRYGMWFHIAKNYLELPEDIKAELILRGVEVGSVVTFLLDKEAYDEDT